MWNLKCIDFCCYSPSYMFIICQFYFTLTSTELNSLKPAHKIRESKARFHSHVDICHSPSHFYSTWCYQKGLWHPGSLSLSSGQQKSLLKASIARREQSCHFLWSNSALPVLLPPSWMYVTQKSHMRLSPRIPIKPGIQLSPGRSWETTAGK